MNCDPPSRPGRVPRRMMVWTAPSDRGQGEVSVNARPGVELFDAHLRDWQCGFEWRAQSDGPGMMTVTCALRQGPPGAAVTLSHQCTDGTAGFEAPSIVTVRDSTPSGDAAATVIARCDGG